MKLLSENPWTQMPLSVYEKHMSSTQVAQLQALNGIMKAQWESYPQISSALVFGVAGGNGLEHCGKNVRQIYGIDLNQNYLQSCAQRFSEKLGNRLKLIQMDLREPDVKLPKADLIIANLFIEYVGVQTFCHKLAQADVLYGSCVIQASDAEQDFVSESPYQAQFQAIGKLHHDINESDLTDELKKHSYILTFKETIELPNGKHFIRLDYKRDGKRTVKRDIVNYTK